jgi:hypothetical protein
MYAQPEGMPVRTTRRGGRRRLTRPLPDPVAIQVRAIPAAAPPYDADGEPGLERSEGAGETESGGVAESGGVDVFAAAIVAVLEQGGAAGAEPGRAAGTGQTPGGAGTPGRSEPDWPSQFAQVLAETLAGSRPPAHLLPWTTERARRHIRRLGPMLTGAQQPVVRRVVTSHPAAGVMEMSVVVGVGPKVRALAIRLEREQPQPPGLDQAALDQSPLEGAGRPGRWMCTAVEAA